MVDMSNGRDEVTREKKLVGYKYLKTYQLATIIYDLTIKFCNKYISRGSRTHDQMVQAGRSGKQNIAEGYLERSLKMYIKLVGVSRGSLDKQLEALEEKFVREGGWSENLLKRRLANR